MINLQNQTILVTREKNDAVKFANEIQKYNGDPIIMPLIETSCLVSENRKQSPVTIQNYEWVFFTSRNGVTCFLKEQENASFLRETEVKIAAVGSKTAEALMDLGFDVNFIPSKYNAEVMAEEFLAKYKYTGRTLFVRGVIASNILISKFTKEKRDFDCYEVYDTFTNSKIADELNDELAKDKIDVFTFTSPSTINAFLKVVKNPIGLFDTLTVCIGTTTEQKAKEVGFTKIIAPEVFTINGMLIALNEYLLKEGE